MFILISKNISKLLNMNKRITLFLYMILINYAVISALQSFLLLFILHYVSDVFVLFMYYVFAMFVIICLFLIYFNMCLYVNGIT